MWFNKNKTKEEKPKEEPKAPPKDEALFMQQITLDHASGGSVNIVIQGKDGKHVEYIANKIKDTFSQTSVPDHIKQLEKELNELTALRDVFNTFRNGKK